MSDPDPEDARTSALYRRLIDAADLDSFIESCAEELELPPFHAYITGLCRERGLVPEQVIKKSGIERTYGHQLFNGTRRPSRDKAIQLAFGLELDLEGAQILLQIAGKNPLYPRIKRDAAILYCLHNRKDFQETQSVLYRLGLTLLGCR